MTRGQIAKDFFLKVVVPVFLTMLLFFTFKPVFTKDGITDYIMLWVVCGIPFGIWRMRLWLIPRGFDIGGTAGIWAEFWPHLNLIHYNRIASGAEYPAETDIGE